MVIATAHLYAPLHAQLMESLQGLAPEDWRKPTVCRGWAVRDIAAHLLDVDVRRLSLSRDQLEVSAPDSPISSYAGLVGFLNRLNADWIVAARRLSPRVLIDLLSLTGVQVAEYVVALELMAPSRFPVAWAGDDVSANWFDVARDYTERWHHQQQIRDAVGAPPLTSAYWLSPVLSTFMQALPHAYRSVHLSPGAAIQVRIEGDAGGEWRLTRNNAAWQLDNGTTENAAARVTLDQDTAWRHFTKGITPEEVRRRIRIEGAAELAEPYVGCLAVMA